MILSAIKQFQEERSVSAVYYLLQGKQSIQSIQDAHLFRLTHYYRVYKHLKKSDFMTKINNLENKGLIQRINQADYYTINEKGKRWLEQNQILAQDLHLNGLTYHQMDDEFVARLLLMIQVWTNGLKKNNKYISVIDKSEVQLWVKSYYNQTKIDIKAYLQLLYDELVQILKSINKDMAEIFILQLTSYQRFGLTTMQLANKYHLLPEDIHFMTMSVIHRILQAVETEPKQYRVLTQMKKGLRQATSLTNSATRTNDLLNRGFTLEQIAKIRHLKINTIYDHIVEIAIHKDDFVLSRYMTDEQQIQITTAIQQIQSYTLKEIKLIVDESISYFQIRLVLAIWNKYNILR